MNQPLNNKELFITILSLSFDDSAEYEALHPQILKFNPPKKFPLIPRMKLNSIKVKLFIGGDYKKALSGEDYFYQVSSDFLTALLSFFDVCLESAPNYLPILIFNVYVSVLSQQDSEEFIPLLLDLLNQILSIKTDLTQFKVIASTCFVNLLQKVMEENTIKNYQPLIQPICTFIPMEHLIGTAPMEKFADFAEFLLNKQPLKTFELFCKISLSSLLSCKDKVPDNVAYKLMEVAMKPLEKEYSQAIIKFVEKIAEKFNPQQYTQFVPVIANLIFKELSKVPVITPNITNSKPCEVKRIALNGVRKEVDFEGTTFKGFVETTGDIKIVIRENIKDIINPKISKVINEIMNFVSIHPDFINKYIRTTIEYISINSENPYYYDSIACILHTYRLLEAYLLKNDTLPTLFRLCMLDKNISIFNQDEYFANRMTLRVCTIQYFAKCKEAKIAQAIESIKEYPTILTEFLLTIAQPVITFPFSNLIISKELINLLGEYRTIVCNDKNREEVSQARIAQFCLLEKIFDNPKSIKSYASSSRFLDELSYILLDKHTRSFAISIIKKYLKISGTVKDDYLNNILIATFDKATKTLNTESLDFAVKIIEFVTQLYDTMQISGITEIIFNRLEALEGNYQSHLYIIAALKFLTKFNKIKHKQFKQIEKGVMNVYGKNPPLVVLKVLLEICYKNSKVNMRNDYEIVYPKAIIMILSMFIESDISVACVQLIIKMASVSEENRILFHKNAIDLAAIELIKKSKSEATVRKLLELIETITLTIGSISTVNNYIGLLCPQKEKCLSPFIGVIFEAFNRMLKRANEVPECGYISDKRHIASVSNIPIKVMDNFTVVFWFFAGKKDGYTNIFSFTDDLGQRIVINYIDGRIGCTVETEKAVMQTKKFVEIPINKWKQISISSLGRTDKNLALITIKARQCDTCKQTFPLLEHQQNTCTFRMGNVEMDESQVKGTPNDSCLIGPLGIFNYLDDKIIQDIEVANPHFPVKDPQPIAYLIPEKKGKEIELTMFQDKTNFTLAHKHPKNSFPTTFIDIFSSIAGYQSLVPLYSSLDLKFSDGSEFENYPIAITHILMNAFSLNAKGQQYFYEHGGFRTISYLLSKADPKNISYPLYLSFVKITDLLNSEELIQDIVTNILCNFKLWFKSSQCEKIFSHWGYSLFTYLQKYVNNCMDVSTILDLMNVYLSYSQEKDLKINITKIRKLLFIAAYNLATYKITREDMDNIIFQALTSDDTRQVNELLDFMYNVTPIQYNEEERMPSYPSAMMLHTLVATKDVNIIVKVLRNIIQIHQTYAVFIVTLEEHLQMVLEELPYEVLTKEFLHVLLKECKKSPVLFNVCCYVGYSIKDFKIQELLEELKPSEEYAKYKFWCIYAVAILLMQNFDTRILITKFIIECGPSAWVDFFSCINPLGACLNVNYDEIEREFVSTLTNIVLSSVRVLSKEESIALFKIIQSFCFVIKRKSFDSEDRSFFVNSPHLLRESAKQIMEMDSHNNMLINNINKGTIFTTGAEEIHRSLHNANFQRRIGVRIGANKLTDADLMEEILDIHEKTLYEENLLTASLSASFLVKDNEKRVNDFIKKIVKEGEKIPHELEILNNKLYAMNKPTIGKRTYKETSQISLSLISVASGNDLCVEFFESYNAFLSKVSVKSQQMSAMTKQGVVSTVINSRKAIVEHENEQIQNNEKVWETSKNDLRIYGSPWYNILKVEGKFRKKRTNFICESLVPCCVHNFYNKKEENVESDLILNSKVSKEYLCERILPNKSYKIILTVTNDKFVLKRSSTNIMTIKYSSVTRIVLKPWLLRDSAIEITTTEGLSIFLNIMANKRDSFMHDIKEISFPRLIDPLQTTPLPEYFATLKYTKMWVEGHLSNFDYLSILNNVSGRTFNSTLQYPIFPWVLNNYLMEEINLKDNSIYMILEKTSEVYSVPRDVKRLLSNIEPFTSLTEEKLSSILVEFLNSMNKIGGYEELTPEFFYMPEVFDDVDLPDWAKSPFEFVYKHRKVLECDKVSANLHKWIDTLWGVKQSKHRDAAPLTADTEKGQMPKQLFLEPHPIKAANKKISVNNNKFELGISNFIVSFVYSQPNGSINIAAIEKDGRVYITNMNCDAQGVVSGPTVVLNRVVPHLSEILQDKGSNDITVKHIANGEFLINENESERLYRVNPFAGTVKKIVEDSSLITRIAACSNYIVYAENNLLVKAISTTDEKDTFEFQVPTSAVTCIDVSESHKILSCGTESGSVIIASLATKKRVMRDVNIAPFVPTNILITKSLGLTVVFANSECDGRVVHKVFVITCNGDIVKEAEIEVDSRNISTFVNSSGFDFIIFTDQHKNFFMFEAYYPENTINLTIESTMKLIAFHPWYTTSTFITVSKLGIVCLNQIPPLK